MAEATGHPEKIQDARITQLSFHNRPVSATAGAVASRPASVVRPDASSLPASAAWAAGVVAASAQARFSQAANWQAGLVFRRLANSLAGCLVGPCSASPVSPEAVWAGACAHLAEKFAIVEGARDSLAPAGY